MKSEGGRVKGEGGRGKNTTTNDTNDEIGNQAGFRSELYSVLALPWRLGVRFPERLAEGEVLDASGEAAYGRDVRRLG